MKHIGTLKVLGKKWGGGNADIYKFSDKLLTWDEVKLAQKKGEEI